MSKKSLAKNVNIQDEFQSKDCIIHSTLNANYSKFHLKYFSNNEITE